MQFEALLDSARLRLVVAQEPGDLRIAVEAAVEIEGQDVAGAIELDLRNTTMLFFYV